jgi:hypothetical protein
MTLKEDQRSFNAKRGLWSEKSELKGAIYVRHNNEQANWPCSLSLHRNVRCTVRGVTRNESISTLLFTRFRCSFGPRSIALDYGAYT